MRRRLTSRSDAPKIYVERVLGVGVDARVWMRGCGCVGECAGVDAWVDARVWMRGWMRGCGVWVDARVWGVGGCTGVGCEGCAGVRCTGRGNVFERRLFSSVTQHRESYTPSALLFGNPKVR
eukprot:363200-Chlamydomonas_euryale.AAC.2